MKVQVLVKTACKNQATSILDTLKLKVNPNDTILNLKSKISDSILMAFPDKEIFFGDHALKNENQIAACGIKEGDCLELVCTATENALAQQLSDLLGAASHSTDELGLLYVHRHGITIGEALKALGRKGEKLDDFLLTQKAFSVKGGSVTVVGADKASELPAIQEDKTSNEGKVKVSVAITVRGAGQIIEQTIDMKLNNSDTVAKAKEDITAVGQVPFPDQDLMLGRFVLEDTEKLSSYGISHGAQLCLKARASEEALVSQLEGLVRARTAIKSKDLSLAYCYRYGVPVTQALKILGLSKDLHRFLECHKKFSVEGGIVTLAGAQELAVPPPQQPVRVVLENLTDRITAAMSFFNIQRMEQSYGPMGAEVIIFVKGLPQTANDKWLPGLLRTLAARLEDSPLEEGNTSNSTMKIVKAEDDTVEVLMEGLTTRLRISPVSQ